MSSTSRYATSVPPVVVRLLAEVGLDDLRVLPHLGGLALGDLLAVVEHRDPLGDPHHDLHVVLDQQDREPALLADPLHEVGELRGLLRVHAGGDRKSTRLNSSHANISYAVFCLKKKKKQLN